MKSRQSKVQENVELRSTGRRVKENGKKNGIRLRFRNFIAACLLLPKTHTRSQSVLSFIYANEIRSAKELHSGNPAKRTLFHVFCFAS